MFKTSKFLAIAALFVMISLAAQTAGAFVIRDIRVEGLQRISAGTVFSYMPYEVGDQVSGSAPAEIIRSLYKTGFFKDVQLEQDGGVLVISVIERPAIAELNINGSKDIKEDDLKEALRQLDFSEGRIFNELTLDKVKQDLRKQYFDRGKYGAIIDSTVTPLERNRVAVDIDVREGRTARIKQINVIGNEVFDEDDLQDEMSLSTGGWFSRFTKDDQYSRQKMGADIEALRSYYMDRGYLKFDVESTQVNISPDKEKVYLTFNVKEGEVYTITDIQLAGKTIVSPEELFPLIRLVRGEPFSRKKVLRSTERITAALSDQGYAFANVNPIPTVDEEAKTVALTFYVEPGRRVYVRRINIHGNSRSRDRVLRREFHQLESSWYSAERVRRSKENLLRLGYFETVDVQTRAVPGSSDQIDIEVVVKEKRSGELMAGVGYSQSGGVSFQARISEGNFFGTGKKVSLGFNTSSANSLIELSYVNPFFTIDGISQGFTLRYRKTDLAELDTSTADYATDTGTFGINFGFPITNYDRIGTYLNAEYVNFKLNPNPNYTSQQYQKFIDVYGSEYTNFKLGLNWIHDSRNKAFFPTSGSRIRAEVMVTLPGSTLTFWNVAYKHQHFFPIITDALTVAAKLDLAYGQGYGDTSIYPIYENNFAGGPGSVRGWQSYSLGPRDDPINPSVREPKATGGNIKTVGSLELWFPPPFVDRNESFRLFGFFDIGNVFLSENYGLAGGVDGFDAGLLRYSAGLGFSWLSPVGALNVSYAYPLNDEPWDFTEEFQFNFGSSF